jgi:hypothetical protein
MNIGTLLIPVNAALIGWLKRFVGCLVGWLVRSLGVWLVRWFVG